MQFRPNKRPRAGIVRGQRIARRTWFRLLNLPVRELVKFTLYNPRTGTNCVIVPYPGTAREPARDGQRRTLARSGYDNSTDGVAAAKVAAHIAQASDPGMKCSTMDWRVR